MNTWLHNNRLHAVVAGGFSMLLAAILMRFVEDSPVALAATSTLPEHSEMSKIAREMTNS